MAKAVLPTNFKDDVLDSSMNGKRRYVLIQNSDGTYSLDDATQYTQVGSTFGQAQINATNKAVNDSVDKAVVIDNISDIAANNTSGKVAGALALKELNRDFETQLPDDVRIIHEGSGVDVKYYAQLGADTASKKLLGSNMSDGTILFAADLENQNFNMNAYDQSIIEQVSSSKYRILSSGNYNIYARMWSGGSASQTKVLVDDKEVISFTSSGNRSYSFEAKGQALITLFKANNGFVSGSVVILRKIQ